MFLDIACIMIDHPKDLAMEIWESSGEYDDYGSTSWSLDRLIAKCLVQIDGDGQLRMHDLVQDMGRHVVMGRAHGKSEMPSHIWYPSIAAKSLQKKHVRFVCILLLHIYP